MFPRETNVLTTNSAVPGLSVDFHDYHGLTLFCLDILPITS